MPGIEKVPENLKLVVIAAIALCVPAIVITLTASDFFGLLIAGGYAFAIYQFVYVNLTKDTVAAKNSAIGAAAVAGLFLVMSLTQGNQLYVILNLGVIICLGFAYSQLQKLGGQVVAPAPVTAAPPAAPPPTEASPTSATAAAIHDKAEKVRMLEELHKSGVLTAEEFERKKRDLG